MVKPHLHRRTLLAGLAASSLLPNLAHAEEYIDLEWDDLLPEGETTIPNALRSLLPHDEEMPLSSRQPESSGVSVPPPPANQLVFVTTSIPYESKGLFEPVNVIGMFGVSSLSTQLAEIGYALSADDIRPFRA